MAEAMRGRSRDRSIADRLQDLQGQPASSSLQPRGESPAGGDQTRDVASLRRMIARIQQREAPQRERRAPQRVAIQDVVPGKLEQTPYGDVFVTTEEFPMDMRRGRRGPRLYGAARRLCRPLALLAREEPLAGISLADLVYFDTETTGLATTSGTYVFLAGLGYADGAIFVVEQLFMRDYAEEPALLWLLGSRLSRFHGIVTYNGRAFDIPLVQARYVTNRVFDPPLPKYHLDMLHPARRLWRARGTGCRLTELEREILGFEREGDVPGWLIPGIYFDAVHRGIVEPLRSVFYHNVQDVLSLAALTIAGADLLDSSEPSADALGEDLYSVARFLEESGQPEALEIYRKAFQWGFRDPAVETEAQCRLGRFHCREGDREEAVRLFSSVAGTDGPFRVFALIELAKHLEHHERDYDRAHQAVEEALRAVRRATTGAERVPARFRPRPADIEYRLRRLDARRRGEPWHPGAGLSQARSARLNPEP